MKKKTNWTPIIGMLIVGVVVGLFAYSLLTVLIFMVLTYAIIRFWGRNK